MFDTDIKVIEAVPWFRYLKARVPIKFGGVIMDSVIFFAVRVTVKNRKGEEAEGWGAIPLADFWGWPSKNVPHRTRERLMCKICAEICKEVLSIDEYMHPVDIFLALEPRVMKIAKQVCSEEGIEEEMPKLNVLICLSALDAAIHDGFGNASGIDSYLGYGKEHMKDLSHYLGKEFKDKFISDYIRPAYVKKIPIFHLVGGLDPLVQSDLEEERVSDGLPETLEDWVKKDGLFCLKVKWRGTDLEWDIRRTLEIFKIARNARGDNEKLYLTGDTNEQCDTPDYMIELLSKIREASNEVFDSILYIEQPTHRDIWNHPHDFSKLSELKPVIIDESLTDFETMDKAISLGAKGIALKTCKGQSKDLLFIAKATSKNIPYAVQDLSVSGISLLQSVGLAARIYTIKGVEYNGRQYFPSGSEVEGEVHKELLSVKEGYIETKTLKGTGFGFQMNKIRNPGQMPGATSNFENFFKE